MVDGWVTTARYGLPEGRLGERRAHIRAQQSLCNLLHVGWLFRNSITSLSIHSLCAFLQTWLSHSFAFTHSLYNLLRKPSHPSFSEHTLKPNLPTNKMRYTTATVTAALLGSASAHTRIYGAWVNGEFQGDGTSSYIRSPPTNDPVKDVTSADIVCNVNGATAASDFVSAAAGDSIALEWYHDSRGDDIIASSHKGPISTYIAEYFEDDGTAAIWTKIDEAGYDSSSDTWAVDDLIAAGGKWNSTIPSDLKAGKYMIRQEIIALHEADTCYATAGSRGAQFYPSCVQFDITGTGSGVPDEDFDFQSSYSCDLPGIQFNLYGDFDSYEIPGPEVETTLGTSSSSTSSSSSSSASGSASGSASSSAVSSATSSAASSAATTAAYDSSSDSSADSSSSSSSSGSSCSKRRKARRAAIAAARS